MLNKLRENRKMTEKIALSSMISGAVVFVVGIVVAILLYDTVAGKYDFFNQFLSELGVREDFVRDLGDGRERQYYAPANPNIFNETLMASGVLMIPFFPLSYILMENKSKFSNFCFGCAGILGLFGGPFAILVGIFDLSTGVNLHILWATLLYSIIVVNALLWILGLLSMKNHPYKSKTIIVDHIFLFLILIVSSLNIFDSLTHNYGIIPVLGNTITIQAFQKIIAIAFFFYFGFIYSIKYLIFTTKKITNT